MEEKDVPSLMYLLKSHPFHSPQEDTFDQLAKDMLTLPQFQFAINQ